MKFLLLSVLLLFIAPSMGEMKYAGSASEKEAKITKEYFEASGKKRAYYLFVPDVVKEAKSVPLLVTLHGSGRDGKSQVEQWREFAQQNGIIVVGPDAKNSLAWQIPDDGPNYLHDLIETIKTKYPINERRVYLFGHSAGANFALLMGLLESEYFAAVAVHAGAIQPNAYPYIERAKRKIPLSIFVGDSDPLFPLTLINATKMRSKNAGTSQKSRSSNGTITIITLPPLNSIRWFGIF